MLGLNSRAALHPLLVIFGALAGEPLARISGMFQSVEASPRCG